MGHVGGIEKLPKSLCQLLSDSRCHPLSESRCKPLSKSRCENCQNRVALTSGWGFLQITPNSYIIWILAGPLACCPQRPGQVGNEAAKLVCSSAEDKARHFHLDHARDNALWVRVFLSRPL